MVETFDAIDPIEAEWSELASRVGAPPFLHPAWFSIWWGAFGAGRLSVLAARRDGRLVGVLPVRSRRGAVYSPTNWHSDVYGPIAEDEEARRELLDAVFAERPRRVDFGFLAAAAGDSELLERAAGRYRVESRVMLRSPYVPIEGKWELYWGSLSGKLRSNVRRRRKLLEREGEVVLDVGDGGTNLDEALECCFRLEASGWKGERGTAIVSQPETRGFYTDTSRWAAERGILRVAFLRLDGAPIAFHLCLEEGGSHYLLKVGHEAKLDRLGSGLVLTARMVERAFELGLESYEFMGAATPYKLRWTDRCRDFVRTQAFAPTVPGRIDRIVQTRGRALAKRVRRRGR